MTNFGEGKAFFEYVCYSLTVTEAADMLADRYWILQAHGLQENTSLANHQKSNVDSLLDSKLSTGFSG